MASGGATVEGCVSMGPLRQVRITGGATSCAQLLADGAQMNDVQVVIALMPDGTFSHRYEHAPYLWPDRPNDEYAYAKHVWKWFAVGYVILWIGMYCVV